MKIAICITFCITLVLVFWGAQSAYLNKAQNIMGPWKTIMCSGVASCLTVVVAGLAGMYFFGDQKPFTLEGVGYGLKAGFGGGVGVAAMTFAFAFAFSIGNKHGSAWITLIIASLLPISYLLSSYLILERPENGWSQILTPRLFIGLIAAVVSAFCVTLDRINIKW